MYGGAQLQLCTSAAMLIAIVVGAGIVVCIGIVVVAVVVGE